MRKLLNTLFVTSEDAYLALENENVVIYRDSEKVGQYPLQVLESILTFSYKGASPALMGACVQHGVHLTFLTPNGRMLAWTAGPSQGNILLRKEQYRVSDHPQRSCLVARNMIFGKVYNGRWVLERTLRDHALRVDAPQLREASAYLQAQLKPILAMEDLDSLRGIEGKASASYFGVLDELILNQKEDFKFTGRSRRPPLDRVNAALSMAYTLLTHDCAAALESVGLDAYAGFMHRDRPGRTSLALDLMEELRAPLADRLVLTLVNTRALQKQHFRTQSGGAVLLTDEGRKVLLTAWQTHKKEEITHPYLKEKLMWGLVPYVQALLLARHLRGDLEEYPPFCTGAWIEIVGSGLFLVRMFRRSRRRGFPHFRKSSAYCVHPSARQAVKGNLSGSQRGKAVHPHVLHALLFLCRNQHGVFLVIVQLNPHRRVSAFEDQRVQRNKARPQIAFKPHNVACLQRDKAVRVGGIGFSRFVHRMKRTHIKGAFVNVCHVVPSLLKVSGISR